MRFGELRQRIADGDDDAAAYLTERFKPVNEKLKKLLVPLAPLDKKRLGKAFGPLGSFDNSKLMKSLAPSPVSRPPLPHALNRRSEPIARLKELDRALDETNRRKVEERRAAIKRERAMVDGIAALREFAEQSAGREIDADARERRADERQRRMFWIGIASSIGTVIAAVAAVIGIV